MTMNSGKTGACGFLVALALLQSCKGMNSRSSDVSDVGLVDIDRNYFLVKNEKYSCLTTLYWWCKDVLKSNERIRASLVFPRNPKFFFEVDLQSENEIALDLPVDSVIDFDYQEQPVFNKPSPFVAIAQMSQRADVVLKQQINIGERIEADPNQKDSIARFTLCDGDFGSVCKLYLGRNNKRLVDRIKIKIQDWSTSWSTLYFSSGVTLRCTKGLKNPEISVEYKHSSYVERLKTARLITKFHDKDLTQEVTCDKGLGPTFDFVSTHSQFDITFIDNENQTKTELFFKQK